MPSTPIDQRLRPVSGIMKSIPGIFGIRLDEELKFYVILREGDMQIRKYRPFILAQTMVRGEFDVARELGMKRLQHFLQGGHVAGFEARQQTGLVRLGLP